MPLSRRLRHRLPLSVTAAATVTAMAAAAVPAVALPDAAPEAPKQVSTPLGVTRAPSSTPVEKGATGQPLVKTAAADPGFYALGVGQVPWSEFYSAQLSDGVSAQVNYGSGNLLVSVEGLDIADAGPGLSVGSVFNSLNEVGWQQTAGADYKITEPTPNGVAVNGPSGSVAVFARDGSALTPAKGYKQDLTEASDQKSFTLTSRRTGEKTTFTRSGTSGDARVSKVEDKNGNATTVTYAGAFTAKITAASGRTLTFTNDGSHITKVTDNTGRSIGYTYSGDDIRTFTDTAGKTTVFDYDTSGRLSRITTPEGRRTAFTWDSLRVAALTRVVDNATGAGNNTAFRWILPAQNTSDEGFARITDPRGHNTLKTVDGYWRTKHTEDALGHTRSKSYGPDNDVATATDAMGATPDDGNVTSYGYDSVFNPTTVTVPTGAQATMSWVKKGGGYFPDTLTSASADKTTNSYDTSGNMLTSEDSTSGGTAAKWTYTYNPKSGAMDCDGLPGQRCTATDPRGKKTTFGHDGHGNLTKITPPAPQKPVTYTYDDLGRQKTVTDGRGTTTTYVYDDRDRVRSQTSGGTTATFTYDDDGNLRTRTTPAGTSTFTYDEQNRERVRTLPGTGTTSVTYDAAGNVATATDSAGTVTYGYDDANQLTSVTEPSGATTEFELNGDGQRTKTTFPGGTVQTVGLDDSDRVKSIDVTSGSTTLSSLAYDYTSGGKDTDRIRKRTLDGAATTYTYDTAGRLTKAVETKSGSTTAGWSYCYDKAGNRTASATGTSLPASCADADHTYTYDDASQLTAYDGQDGFSYDGSGNETSAEGPTGTRTAENWTPFTQLAAYAQSGATVRQSYAGTDNTQRLTRDATTFANTAVGLTGQTASGAATGFIREPSGTLVGMRSGASTQYYLSDAQGSVIGLVDTAGKRTATYTYGPYGEQRTNTGTQQPFRYAGTYLDPSGLYKMGARYYDPNLGRFTQPDPSGKEKNAYLYAGGDPVNKVDPSGTFGFVDLFSTTDSLLTVRDAIKAGLNGDTGALWSMVGSAAASLGTEIVCQFALGFFAVPTAGMSEVLGQAVCATAAYDVGKAVG
ncbi:RHS repeat-associated core domain-containing protein [Streptomyces sviceus]|uniref:RHS repeat-associated core domain-containing protein n=1 Tax=Streptomyces sviceus TaxID=285530 RepID=UPI003809E01E